MAKTSGKSATSAKTKKSAKKPIKKTPVAAKVAAPIVLTPVPSAWAILKRAVQTVWAYRRLMFGIALIYGVISLLFQGAGLFSVNNIKATGAAAQTSAGSTVGATLTAVLGGGGNASGAASVLQFILLILASLAVIWALRHIYAKQPVSITDAYYKSAAPLVPFLLVLFVVAVQFIPAVIGSTIYQVLIVNNIANSGAERLIAGLVALVLIVPTFYWITSSLFALYIVTLPDMRPMAALRSAKELVTKRRLLVLRKLVVLPFALFMVIGAIMVPVIILVPVLGGIFFFVLSAASLLLSNTYMYMLYRELLGE